MPAPSSRDSVLADLEQHAQREKARGAAVAVERSRLAALTSQINPHFLFNTLNSVSSLIRTNPDQARTVVLPAIGHPAPVAFATTDNLTPLRDELGFIDNYMAIEMVRYGESCGS